MIYENQNNLNTEVILNQLSGFFTMFKAFWYIGNIATACRTAGTILARNAFY